MVVYTAFTKTPAYQLNTMAIRIKYAVALDIQTLMPVLIPRCLDCNTLDWPW